MDEGTRFTPEEQLSDDLPEKEFTAVIVKFTAVIPRSKTLGKNKCTEQKVACNKYSRSIRNNSEV